MKKMFLLLTLCLVSVLNAEDVIYVHGYLNINKDDSWSILNEKFNDEKKLLSDIFPGYKITVKKWDSVGKWSDMKKAAETLADLLLWDIKDMSEKKQQELIVIGHSLGGVALPIWQRNCKNTI